MKKFIQIVSFLALVFVMAGTEINAQNVTKINAVIPYDFSIGDEKFEAGRYVMRVKRMQSGVNLVELRDSSHRVVHESFALDNGDPGTGKANLVFDRSGSVAKLTHVRTGERGFTISGDTKGDGSVKLASKKKKNDSEAKN
ncbi:MAG: hypothetical protein AB7V18_05910 [Pyrinomonadaceae bacterium]